MQGYSDFRVEFVSPPVDVAPCRMVDFSPSHSQCGQLDAAMSMRQTIAVISQTEADGIISRYAIGGAVASFLYIDVTFTEDLDILVSLDNQTGKSGLLQVMENVMQSNAEIDGVLAANDAMAIGAIEALDGANRKALVVGINGTKEAVDAIKSGKLLASGDYNGFAQGCLGTMIAIRSLRKEPIIPEIVLAPTVITKDNYQPYDVALESRTCPTWEEGAKMGMKR